MRRNSSWRRAAKILALGLFSSQLCAAQQKVPDTEKLLFDAANHERTERKLPPLRWDEGLARAARKHAEMMAEQDLLEHQLQGEHALATRASEAGASFSHITENIGMAVDAYKFHDGWMQSPGHRANILAGGYSETGVVLAPDGRGQLIFVQTFGAPQ